MKLPRRLALLALGAASCVAQTTPPKQAPPTILSVQRIAGSYFYLQLDATTKHALLMTRNRSAATPRTLFDLTSLPLATSSSRYEMQPSWDGQYVAVGVTIPTAGYNLHIVNAATRALLPESIPRSFDGDVVWADDNHSFFYRQFQPAPAGTPANAIFTNMRAYRHTLGEDPSRDQPVFGSDINPALHLPVVGAVNAFPLPGTSVILGVQSSAPTELDSFWAINTGDKQARWRKIIDHADEVLFEFSSRGSTLYFITRHNQPSGQLMAFDAAREDISHARPILPISDLQLADRNRDGVLCAKDALYLYGHRKESSVLIRVPYDDPTRRTEIALPFPGTIADVSGDLETSGLIFSLTSDTHPLAIYEYDPTKNRVTDTHLTQ